jgi:hypothetical protein
LNAPALIDDVTLLLSRSGYECAIILHGLDSAGNPGIHEVSVIGRTVFGSLIQAKLAGDILIPRNSA